MIQNGPKCERNDGSPAFLVLGRVDISSLLQLCFDFLEIPVQHRTM